MESSWLDKLKKPRNLRLHTDTKVEETFFQLYESREGVGIEVVNAAGTKIEVSYLDYSGYERQLIQILDRIREQQDFTIDWDNPDQEILLLEPQLLALEDVLVGVEHLGDVLRDVLLLHGLEVAAVVKVV